MQGKGWPLTDPYPYRDSDHDAIRTPPECNFVKYRKQLVEDVKGYEDFEESDYLDAKADAAKNAWDEINVLTVKLEQALNHIKWLTTVGGENLNMACGLDIVCRGLEEKKIKKEKKHGC